MADEEQCIFCHIAAGKIPAKKVYEDENVVAVLDINPAIEGHMLVIPKKHVAVMPQMDDLLVQHMGMVAKQLSQALIRAFKAEGTSVFAANGAAAGQRAPHFMMHVMPRKENDGVALQLPVLKVDEKTMTAIFSKLAPVVAKQFGKEPVQLAKPKEEIGKPEEKIEKEKPSKPSEKKDLDAIADMLLGGKK